VSFTIQNFNGGITTGIKEIHVADIDGDGKQDILVLYTSGISYKVFRNISTIGNPAFEFVTGAAGYNIASIDDFDNDGKPDIAFGLSNSGTITVFRNSSKPGSVTFNEPVNLSVTGSVVSLSSGDVSADGVPDVIASSSANTISVFKSTGAIGVLSFAPGGIYSLSGSPGQAIVSDIDGDGKQDLLVANNIITSTNIWALRNTSTSGDIQFGSIVNVNTGAGPKNLSVGDIDSDGQVDFAVSNYNSNTVSVLRNLSFAGTLAFAAKVDYPVGQSGLLPAGIAMGDYNGDGQPEIAVANGQTSSSTGPVIILRRLPTCQPPVITGISPGTGVAGNIITIQGNNFGETMSANAVSFGAAPASIISASATQVQVIIPAGVANQYISVANLTNGSLGYFAKPFNTTFNCYQALNLNSFIPSGSAAVGTNPEYISAGDIDGDGRQDVVVPNYGSSSVSVLLNSGSSGEISFNATTNLSTGTAPAITAVGDVDMDGRPDIAVIWGASTAPRLSVFINRSTPGVVTFLPRADYVTPSYTTAIGIGDVDGDGRPEIVVSSNSAISIFRNLGKAGITLFANKQDILTNFICYDVAMGDIDSDGKADLICANATNNQISIFRNQSSPGTIAFGSAAHTTTGSGPYSLAVADVDSDGKLDISVASISASRISIHKNLSSPGTILLAAKVDLSFGSGVGQRKLVAGDLDGDSKIDLGLADYTASALFVLGNTSQSGVFSFNKVDLSTASPSGGVFGDFNSDGRLDIAASNYASNNISIFKNVIAGAGPVMNSPAAVTTCSNVALNHLLTSDQPSTYQWIASDNPNTTGESVTVQSGGILNDLITNTLTTPETITYSVTPTSVTGSCPGTTQTVTVNVKEALRLSSSLNAGATCSGVIFNYPASTVSANPVFNWSRPATPGISEPASGGTGNVNEMLTNTMQSPVNVVYTYVITANGCTNAPGEQVTATVNPAPVFEITPAAPSICPGSSVLLTVLGEDTYAWAPNPTLSAITAATATATPATTGTTYTVTGTNAYSCPTVKSVVVTWYSLPPAPSGSSLVKYCENATAVPLTAYGSNLLWYTVATGGTGTVTAPTPATSVVGTVSYYVSQTVNGCEGPRKKIDVEVTARTAAVITASGPTHRCTGQTLTLSAPVGVGFQYQWYYNPIVQGTPRDIVLISSSQSITVPSSGSAHYVLFLTNASGCTTSSEVNITETVAQIVGSSTYCSGATNTLSATTGTGVGLTYTYNWQLYSSSTWVSKATTPTYTISATGKYRVIITDSKGCVSTSPDFTVTSMPAPLISPSGDVCSNGYLTLTAPSGTSYLWSTGATTQSISGYPGQTYTVTVTYSSGCTRTSKPFSTDPCCPYPPDCSAMRIRQNQQEQSMAEQELFVSEISVYPNPVNTELTVHLPAVAESDVTIKIHSLYGSIMSAVIPKGQVKTMLHMDKIPNGIYIIEVQTPGSKPSKQKIVVTHSSDGQHEQQNAH
jgi:hypothetical protein